MRTLIVLIALAMGFSTQCEATELMGPARFCGYSPIIDLLPGEKVTTLDGGIHGGRFRWEGAFGTLDVNGIGWASRPPGQIVEAQTSTKPARFAQRQVDGGYVVAIWNGSHGAAYFKSATSLTPNQITAINRVTLFEWGETPTACDLQTIFSWE